MSKNWRKTAGPLWTLKDHLFTKISQNIKTKRRRYPPLDFQQLCCRQVFLNYIKLPIRNPTKIILLSILEGFFQFMALIQLLSNFRHFRFNKGCFMWNKIIWSNKRQIALQKKTFFQNFLEEFRTRNYPRIFERPLK